MSEQALNKAGNEVRSITEALPEWRRDLDRMRAKHGADSAIGRRCSNLIEQLKNYQESGQDWREELGNNIAKSVADLTRLSTQNAEERGSP